MAARPSVLSAFTIASTFVCLVEHAAAHEPPFGVGVLANGTQQVLPMSRGLVLRSAERPDYRLLCSEALGVGEYDVPSVLMRGDGSLLVGTSTGLKHVSADGCTVELLPAFGEARVSALVRDPHDSTRLYAATDVGLYETHDEGDSFVQLDEHVVDSLEVPDDTPGLVLVTGTLPSAAGHVRAFFGRSQSGAALELQEFALEPNEYRLMLLGSAPGRIFAVARAYLGTLYPSRLLVSDDGARSWQNPLSAPGVGAVAVDSSTGAWLVGDAAGLWRTSAAAEPPEQLGTAAVSCLGHASSHLFMCDGSGPEGGISLSADGGEHWRSLLRWNQVAGLVDCSPDTPSMQLCQTAWEDWTRELPPGPPLSLDVAEQLDAVTAPRARTGCAANSGQQATTWLWLTPVLILARRRPSKRPP